MAKIHNCSGLTSVIIPNSVTSIGNYAFYGCSSLISVTIGSGILSIGSEAFFGTSVKKVIWLTNTPPSGYHGVNGTTNYVANNNYTGLSNVRVYPFLSSMFEVDGIKYVPVSPSERTCDAIDCAYNESAENINIGESVTNKGVSLTVKQVGSFLCYRNRFIKNVNLSFQGDINTYAFSDCYNLNLAIISNQGSIGDSAFSGTILHTAELGQEITSIGSSAFQGCSILNLTIPDAVNSIGNNAFENCTSMTSAKIGNGVQTIGSYAFRGCHFLQDIQIGTGVTSIGTYAFSECTSLPTIQIPKNVTSIGNYVFSGCKGLKTVLMDDSETELYLGSNGSNPLFANCPLDSVYIGRNITYPTASDKGYSPFYRNTKLRSVTITDKETEISLNEFYGCTNLKNVFIGDGVTSFGDYAFSGCSSLDHFAFGSSVMSIGKEAFSDCTAMTSLISKATTPPTCGSQALDDINKWSCTLTVPQGHIQAYQQANQWKEFFFINEGNGDEPPVIPDPMKCTKPTISYTNGKLTFNCKTEDVIFHSSITDTDIKSYNGNEVDLTVTYYISVYATKEDYEDSEVATGMLCWIDQQPSTEGIVAEDAVTEVKALPVLIQSNGGTITIQGANEGTEISVYSVNGMKQGSAIATQGLATINTSLQPGTTAIVKIGEKAIKVLVK